MLLRLYTYIKEEWFGVFPTFGGVPRSPQWPRVRAAFIAKNPACFICGGKKELNVHHKQPYHLFPELELVESNLITLCNHQLHHIIFGHLGTFMSYNKDIEDDAHIWRGKFSSRPSGLVETDN